MKLEEKNLAIKLRQKGWSYSKILRRMSVSKSTLSLWLRDIELTAEQQKKLLKGLEKSRYIGGRIKYDDRLVRTRNIIEESSREFSDLIKNPLFSIGLSLYLAEGDKNRNERVKFTNSDPALIRLMMKWFREICNVPEKKFRISVHIHDLQSRSNASKFWSTITKLPLEQFHKLYIKRSTLRRRRNVLYNGTCSIIINNRYLFRRILGWRIGLFEYFGVSPRSSMDRIRDF